VGFVHDVQPFLGAAFAFADESPHPVDQYFRSGARQGIHPRLLEGSKHVVMALFFLFADMGDFGWPEGMELQGWIHLFQLAEERSIELQAQFRVMAALEQQLVSTPFERLFYLPFVGGDVGDISVGMAGYAIEITKLTIGDTDIGGIDIPVYLPGDLSMGNCDLPQLVGQVHEFRKRGVLKEKDAFFDVQIFAVVGLLI
jgi:hypothetical protein